MLKKPVPLVIALLLFTAFVAVALVATLDLLHIPPHPIFYAEIAFFATITYVLLTWQEAALVTDPKGFVRRFMTGLVVKMLVSLMLVLIIAFLAPRPQAIALVLGFALLYLAYLVFSVARLMMRSKRPA